MLQDEGEGLYIAWELQKNKSINRISKELGRRYKHIMRIAHTVMERVKRGVSCTRVNSIIVCKMVLCPRILLRMSIARALIVYLKTNYLPVLCYRASTRCSSMLARSTAIFWSHAMGTLSSLTFLAKWWQLMYAGELQIRLKKYLVTGTSQSWRYGQSFLLSFLWKVSESVDV